MHRLEPLTLRSATKTRGAGAFCPDATIHVASFPNPNENPFLRLLYEHLSHYDVHRHDSPEYLSRQWIRQMAGTLDYFHFHWPSLNYSDAQGKRTLGALLRFAVKLSAARRLGTKSIWTMHNLYPHERQSPVMEWLCRFAVAQSVDLVFTTHEAAVGDLRRYFMRTRDVWVTPHGNYVAAYPEIPHKQAARQRLGIDASAFLVLVFGQLRRYKGADIAARALAHLPASDVKLMIVGQARDADYAAELEDLAARDGRIGLRISNSPVPDPEVALWLAACDCIAAPYRDIYTSGVLYLAATFAKPIAAPRLGLFRSQPAGGFIETYEAHDGPKGLAAALSTLKCRDPLAMTDTANAFCAAHDWDRIACRMAQILRDERADAGHGCGRLTTGAPRG